MIRLLRLRGQSRRARAAEQLLDRHDRVAETDSLLDTGAALEMERIWALTGAVAHDPRILAALDADLARYPSAPRRRYAPLAAALALGLVGAGTLAWVKLDDKQVAIAAAPSVATQVGQRKRMVLPDTSSVALDTDSEVAVAMSDTARAVTLRRGRAFFRVAKDPSRPFVVSAGDKRVRAVGTAFEVRIDRGDVVVTVVEGTVEVSERPTPHTATHTARVGAGTQLVALPHNDWAIRRIDPEQSTIWLTGRLSFVDEPLATAIAEMNRYAPQKLVFDGPVPDQRILGVFKAGDTLALAQAIELNGAARIVEVTPERILVEAK